jgi:hypothetical protein
MIPALKKYHSRLYIAGIILLAVSLPLSRTLLSVAQFILIGNWILEGNFRTKYQRILDRKSLLPFLLVFLAHIIWLLPTTDYGYALHDIKIKLPLLVIPLVLATSKPLRENALKMVLLFFIAAVIISSLFSIYRLSILASIPMSDMRDISVFMSHIRLALLVNISIFSLLYLIITDTFRWNRLLRNLMWASLAWLTFFLFILQSITGIIIFFIAVALFLARFSSEIEKQYWYIRNTLVYGMSPVIAVILIYILAVSVSFIRKPVNEEELKTLTPNGNQYYHYPQNRQIENGNYVWINICDHELEFAWNRRSSLDYRGPDLKGHDLRTTLIRYLASLGYDKDVEGVANLTETDIVNIERGMSNYIFQYNRFLYPRIYQILWEIDNYRKGGNPTGHSFSQRIEYWKAAMGIVRDNFWLGVGTGDVVQAYRDQYAKGESRLEPQWQLRAHNQFLTFMVSFGIFGFIMVIYGIAAPFIMEKGHNRMLPFVFICVAVLSMLAEDTLETQAGATFFAFFYSLFIFAGSKSGIDEIDQQD